MSGVIDVRFPDSARTYRFDPGELRPQVGEMVLVDTAQGREMGVVASTRRPLIPSEEGTQFRPVNRLADAEDLRIYEENAAQEMEAFRVCRDMIDQHQLDMNLVAAEYTFDDRKLLFYFTADGRIDFRDLVRELAAHFRLRIELRQIGVRDDAKKNGGMGICGRELCCSSWMENFVPVSIRMAKEQNISMNPTKVSGMCGRLLCCLNYENEVYKQNRKLLPKQGAMVNYQGSMAKVIGLDIPALQVILLPELPDGSWGHQEVVKAEAIGYGERKAPAAAANKERDKGAEKSTDKSAEKHGCSGGDCHCPKKQVGIDREKTELVSAAEYSEETETDTKNEKVRPPRRAATARKRGRGKRSSDNKDSAGEQKKPRYIIDP